MNAKEMVKAMRVGLEPIRKVEIGALEDVLCIRFPEKSGVWVKSSGGMPFVRPEKSLHSFCVLRGDEGEGAKPRKHRLLCLASDGRAPDKSSIKEVRDEMSEDGWLRAIRRFSSDGSEASASSLKCFVEFIPVTLDVIRVAGLGEGHAVKAFPHDGFEVVVGHFGFPVVDADVHLSAAGTGVFKLFGNELSGRFIF